MNIFHIDSPLNRFLSRVADLLILNLLGLVCSLPVITAGAAMAATHKVSFDILRQEESGILRTFFRAFRDNFRQATIGWLIYLVTLALLVLDLLLVLSNMSGMVALVLTILALCVIGLLLGSMCYFFPMLTRYQNTVPRQIYNSCLLVIGELPRTLGLLAVELSPLLLFLISPSLLSGTLLLWVLLGFSGIIMLQQWLLKSLFEKLEKE